MGISCLIQATAKVAQSFSSKMNTQPCLVSTKKGHTYLNRPAGFKYVSSFCEHQALKG